MFGCRRIVIRPPVYFPKSRNVSSQHQSPKWPESPAGEGAGKMRDVVKESNETAAKANKPSDEIKWAVNRLYDPLRFLRPQGPSQRITTPYLVGPDARTALQNDVFRQLDIDPMRETNNPELLKTFITSMGKIRPRSQTKLSWRSQRKVAKAIRRAKQKGVLSVLARNGFRSH